MCSAKILNKTIDCNSNNLTLQWNNLTCDIENKNGTLKRILNNVSGSIRSKSFTAILGPSGAGKTTLLEGISCASSRVKGTVSLNEYFMSHVFMKEISGFLPQHNIAHDCLTAKEHLQFVCTMKMRKILNYRERNSRVIDILKQLGLESCQNTQLAELSGGERRRLFLGKELVSDPAIFFCDEPTTGLDSYNALQIISILRDLSLNGKIIIISIHQPSSDLIQFFDNFILLSKGNVILEGNKNNITRFLNELNLICPEKYNIAEFYIQLVSIKPGEEEKCIEKINDIHNEFLKHQNSKIGSNICPAWRDIYFAEKLKCSYYEQFYWLMWREGILLKRKISTDIVTFSILIVTAFIIALFYSSADNNLIKVQDLKGFLHMIVSELLFTATYVVLHTFPQEISIFKSEKDLYSSTIYYLVKVSSEIPQTIIYPYSFLLVLYSIVPFDFDIYLYFKIGFVMCIASITAKAYGFMLSVFSDSSDYLNLIIIPIDTIFLITSGIFIKLDTLPFLLVWLKYISSFFYAFDAISILYWTENNNTAFNETHLEYVNNNLHNFNSDLYCLIILAIIMYSIGCFTLIRKKKQYSNQSY